MAGPSSPTPLTAVNPPARDAAAPPDAGPTGPQPDEHEPARPSPAWDAPLARAPFAFVDLEMTGLDPAVDRVCEVCVIRTAGASVLETLETLVRPTGEARFDERASRVHGIAPHELTGAPTFADLAPGLRAILDGAILVAHGAAHDVAFLRAEFARTGDAPPLGDVLDTLPLARRCYALPTYRLEHLARSLAVAQPRPHRAGDDARALLGVFAHLVALLEPRTPRDLWFVRVGEGKARPALVERARHAVAEGLPVVIRYRPSHRAACELTMILTAVQADLDPPRVLGYLVPGRGRRELRADRILAISPAPGAG